MDPTLIAVALILSSASLVWGLVRLWQRNIARGPPPPEPPAPAPSDRMHLALRQSGIDAPGAEALQHGSPWPADVVVSWSARLDGACPLELAVADDRSAVGWPVVGGVDAWIADAGTQTALAKLGLFGGGLKLQTEGHMAWLLRDGRQTTDPFDLLCQLAAAAWLAGPPEARQQELMPGELYPVAWQADGWESGALPPFGRLRVEDDLLRLWAPSRLPTAGGQGRLAGVPEFGAHELVLPRAGLQLCLVEEEAVRLESAGLVVIARHLSGSMAASLSERGLLAAPSTEGEEP